MEGEILFEGQAGYSKKLIRELLCGSIVKKLFPLSLISVFAVCLGIIEFIYTETFILWITSGLLIGFIALLLIMQSSYMPNLIYKRFCEQNNGKEHIATAEFYKDEIILRNLEKGSTANFSYESIKEVYTTKNLIVLLTRARVAIVIEKTKLTLGGKDELMEFVKNKAAI